MNLSVTRYFLAATFFLLLVSQSVFSQVTIVGYDSTNPNGAGGAPSPDLPAAEAQSDVSALMLARGPGLIPNQGITLNSSNWSTSSTLDTNSDDYVSWGWNNATGVYDLENMTIQYDRSGAGPTQLAITVSVNGGAQQTVFTDPNINQGDETHTIGLTAFDNVLSAEFRLFGFDASSLGGTLDIERFNSDPDPSRAIVVRGFVVAVPEPGGILVISGFAMAWLVRRRRNDAISCFG